MKELILKAQAGCSHSEEQLIIKNKNLIYLCMIDYQLDRNDEDLFSIGMYGLLMAVRTYDINKGFEFSTYAANVIKGEFVRYIAYINREKRCDFGKNISTEEELGEDFTVGDTIACKYTNKGYVMSEYRDLNVVLLELNFIERKIFEMRFFEMKKVNDIIEILDIDIDIRKFYSYIDVIRQKVANGLLA